MALRRDDDLEEWLLELHAQAINGDSAAREELPRPLSASVRRRLRQIFPRGDAHRLTEAADDAVLVYIGRPEAFDSARGSLVQFVSGIATNIFRTRLRAATRRSQRESNQAKDDVQDRRSGDYVHLRAESEMLRALLPQLCNQVELAAMNALLDEDDTAAVAVALGISHLPLPEQRLEKKRVWARVVKRFQKHLDVAWRAQKKRVDG